MLPDVYFGDVTEKVDWRNVRLEDRSSDNDEELVPTPPEVVDLLGFDPRLEFGKSGEESDLEKAGDGIMVAWYPPADMAEDLAVDGGEDPEEIHLTLSYFGKDLTDEQIQTLKDTVAEYCSRFAPLEGAVGGTGRFPATESSDNKDVLIRLVDVGLLEKLREGLLTELADKGIAAYRNHGYTPHMTMAYVDPEDDSITVKPKTVPIVIDKLTVVVGGEHTECPLDGEEVLKGEPTSSQVHVPVPLGSISVAVKPELVWRVIWADGRAQVYFEDEAAARKFYRDHDGDEIKQMEKPDGVRVRKLQTDAPNYRPADGETTCANCIHGGDGYCDAFHFNANSSSTCSSHEPMAQRFEKYTPPREMQSNAVKAVAEYKANLQSEDRGDEALMLLAGDIANGRPLDKEQIQTVYDYLLDHYEVADQQSWSTHGKEWQEWFGLGGRAGLSWSQGVAAGGKD